MHLSFTRLFSDQETETLGHVELEDDNTFGLPAGNYLIHDLYPISPEHGSDLFFTVERVDTGEVLLTARLRTDPQQLNISPEHLQSARANDAMALLTAVLSDANVQNHLSERLMAVSQFHLAVTLDRTGLDRNQMRETMLKELEKEFPGSDRSQIEALLDNIEAKLGPVSESKKE